LLVLHWFLNDSIFWQLWFLITKIIIIQYLNQIFFLLIILYRSLVSIICCYNAALRLFWIDLFYWVNTAIFFHFWYIWSFWIKLILCEIDVRAFFNFQRRIITLLWLFFFIVHCKRIFFLEIKTFQYIVSRKLIGSRNSSCLWFEILKIDFLYSIETLSRLYLSLIFSCLLDLLWSFLNNLIIYFHAFQTLRYLWFFIILANFVIRHLWFYKIT